MTEVVSGEAVVLDVPAAAFPSRIVALLLDMLVQGASVIAALFVITAASSHLDDDTLLAIIVTTFALIIIGYPAAFETLSRGRSLGKMAMGLRVVSDDGGPERFRQALVRALTSVIEIWAFSGAPALITSMVSARGKRLGDLFAGTFVIQERLPRRPGLPPAFAVIPPPLLGWAQTLEISGLSDQVAEQAASYLRRVWELTPAAREEFGQRIAAAVVAQVTPPPPPGTPPAAFLSAVLAVRRQREMARMASLQAMVAGTAQAAPNPWVRYPSPPYQGPWSPAASNPGAARHPAPQPPAPQYPAAAPAAREQAPGGFAPPN